MSPIINRFLTKSKFQIKVDDNISQCLNCERRCKIQKGETGFCGTRANIDGIIYSIVYGKIPAESCNPIEKKPFYNFHPGTTAYTVGTYGCNFACFWCQNYHLSHPNVPIKDYTEEDINFLSPESLIEKSIQKNCEGISISFNEPTLLFEYSVEAFKLAKKKGLYTTYVSNGYMTEDVTRELIQNGLDAINIDIKGDLKMVKKYCKANLEKVWRNANIFAENGVHLEITTLLIEGFNTSDHIINEIINRLKRDLGKSIPIHFTRAIPYYRSDEYGFNEPTSIKILERAYELAKLADLKYIYLGNVGINEKSNTYCPSCSKLVIERSLYGISKSRIDEKGNCKYCGYHICKR